MASLVEPLAVGFAAAASGTAEFYRQGTSTLLDVYSDSEAVTAVTTHPLDSAGKLVRYIKARADVVVKNAAGATVSTFTAGGDAREVRVENLGFTGTLANGTTGAGGRTTVDACLTSIFASLGATDGLVDVNGVPTTLSAAIGSSFGLVYNVQSYGALGNDIADDSGAIAQAIAAAATAGGGIVYFPRGTYAVFPGAGFDLSATGANITFLGASEGGSIIKCYSDAIDGLYNCGAHNVSFENLTFSYSSTSFIGQGTWIARTGKLVFRGCTINCHDEWTFSLADASADVSMFGCTINVTQSNTQLTANVTLRPRLRLVGCTLNVSGNGTNLLRAGYVQMTGSTINFTGANLTLASSSVLFLSGSFFNATAASGTITLMSAGTLMATGNWLLGAGTATMVTLSYLYEAGNLTTNFGIGTIPVAAGLLVSQTRDLQLDESTVWSAATQSYTPSALKRNHYISLTYNGGASAYTINAPTSDPGGGGALLTVIVHNTSAQNHTLAWNATFLNISSLTGLAANAGTIVSATFARGGTGWRLLQANRQA
jgi:hypothetical protein